MKSANILTLNRLVRFSFVLILLTLNISKTRAQSKCDKVCSNDFTCSSGKCILTVSNLFQFHYTF